MEQIKQEGFTGLDMTDNRMKNLVTAGYVMAILGGLIGVFIGQYLAGHRTTLPDGKIIFSHTDEVRRHGRYILTLGTIVFVVLACLKLGRII